jgi:hypothetical protein
MGPHDSRNEMMVKKSSTPDTDWQRIWFTAARQRDWSSLALVPSDASADVGRLAQMLAMTGQAHGERPVAVVNATGVRLEDVEQVIDSFEAIVARAERALVPVDPIADNPAAIPILRACSAAILVVGLRESLLADAQNTIEIVGRDRFLGSVVVDRRGRVTRTTAGPAGLQLGAETPRV